MNEQSNKQKAFFYNGLCINRLNFSGLKLKLLSEVLSIIIFISGKYFNICSSIQTRSIFTYEESFTVR
jgi:hypothetical protein